ncbi:MAG: hypothetical protein U0975_02110 [Erythrobacter sp.]|nr:hypothetical protein [Erythrobacter sp.]
MATSRWVPNDDTVLLLRLGVDKTPGRTAGDARLKPASCQIECSITEKRQALLLHESSRASEQYISSEWLVGKKGDAGKGSRICNAAGREFINGFVGCTASTDDVER